MEIQGRRRRGRPKRRWLDSVSEGWNQGEGTVEGESVGHICMEAYIDSN